MEGDRLAGATGENNAVAMIGAFDRRLHIVRGRKLIVVRAGASAGNADFDQQLWPRLIKVIG